MLKGSRGKSRCSYLKQIQGYFALKDEQSSGIVRKLILPAMSGRLLKLMIMLLVALGAGAQSTQPRAKVRVYINEHKLSDSERAKWYALIMSSQSEKDWPQIRVGGSQTLITLVDNYFDLFSNKSKDANPKSARLLIDAIQQANHLDSQFVADGAVLKLPPVPVRANSRYAKKSVWFRSYDAKTQTYTLAGIDGTPIKKSSNRTVGDAKDLQVWRTGRISSTRVEIPVDELLKARATGTSVFPKNAIITTEDGFDVISLFQSPGDCDRAANWLDASPYKASLAIALRDVNKDSMLSKARTIPLVVIDWDLTPGGHGGKVLSVANFVLSQLGFHDFSSEVKSFELNPASSQSAKEALRGALDAYKQYYSANGNWGDLDLDAVFKKARKWIDDFAPPAQPQASQRIPSLLMQAVLYKHFAAEASFVNLSFSIESSALDSMDPHFMLTSRSFGVFAAGNNHQELSSVMMPQAWASGYPNLINVTFGRADGTVLGDYSDLTHKMFVSLIAPGCGYADFSDHGSSFASPYVATSLWVKYLIRTQPSLSDLKRLSILTSRPTPPLATEIESGGVFDPALLLSNPGAHLLDSSGSVTFLTSVDVNISIIQEDGNTLDLHFPHDAMNSDTTISFFVINGIKFAYVRKWNEKKHQLDSFRGQLTGFTAHAVRTNLQNIDLQLSDVASNVKSLTF